MVGLLKILLQLSTDRGSQTAFQLTLDLRGTLRATSNPATVGDKFNTTSSDAWSDLHHYHEHAHHIDQEHLSEHDPTYLQPCEWVH